jgi:hypothetical protein
VDASRKANREDNEKTLQYQSRQQAQLAEELSEDKLTQLLALISSLEKTPAGAAELERRTQLLGKCERIEGETAGQFHTRLRHWFDRDLPQTKSPLHPPRQMGD